MLDLRGSLGLQLPVHCKEHIDIRRSLLVEADAVEFEECCFMAMWWQDPTPSALNPSLNF